MEKTLALNILSVSGNLLDNLNFNDQEEVKNKKEEINSQKNGTVLLQIKNYEKKTKEESIEFSEPFYTSENGLKMRIKIWFDNGFIYPSIELLPGEFDHPTTPLIHLRATFSILDQSGRSKKSDRVKVYEPRFGSETEEVLNNDLFSWPILTETDENEMYVKNDKIFIMAKIEPLTSLFCNYVLIDGVLMWSIDNYLMTKRESIKRINDEIYSDYFHTSKSGFRMKARVEFDDENIYFCLLFLVGEFDSKLPSYFNHSCTVSLVNQENSISSEDLVICSNTLDSATEGEKKVREAMSTCFCHVIVAPQSEVENEPFLANDKLVVRFVVKAL